MEISEETKSLHEPVLLEEVIEGLRVKELARSKQARFIDATLGLGGHSTEIIKSGGYLLGIEADLDSLKIARERLEEACPTPEGGNFRGFFKLAHGNFREIWALAKENGFVSVDGVLFDLGISSFQLRNKGRGLSFQDAYEPLDMRVDPSTSRLKASDLLKALDKTQLADLFEVVLKPGLARTIARRIAEERTKKEISTVGDFLSAIRVTFRPKSKLDPATLPFLALRIAVNSELSNLRSALPQSFDLLRPGGRMVIISFHSGEDSIVKNFYKQKVKESRAELVNKKPIVPNLVEIERNPRARSAKLRILQKI